MPIKTCLSIALVVLISLPMSGFAEDSELPQEEVLLAQRLNISVYELRASKLLNLVSLLLSQKKQERERAVPGLGAITESQVVNLRTQRLAARTNLNSLCEDLKEIE